MAGLLRRLWRNPPVGHQYRSLQRTCDAWADDFERKFADGLSSMDAEVARQGIGLLRALPATAERTTMLCTDLHAGNILAADREPWLVIDPKPHVGDPAYDVLQHLLNCPRRLEADPVGLVTTMAKLAGLCPKRLRLWLFARCVQESLDWPGLADVAIRVAPL